MNTLWVKALKGTEIGLGVGKTPIVVVTGTQGEMYKAICQLAKDEIRRDSRRVHPDIPVSIYPLVWRRQMNKHDLQRLAELADEHEFIRDAITPPGLALLEKYRRENQPWWVRAWRWLRRK